MIASAPPQRKENSDQYHYGRNGENVKRKGRDQSTQADCPHRDTEHECVVDFLAIPSCFEANPPEREGKGHRSSENASPRQEPMCRPARVRAPIDESLQDNVVPEDSCQVSEVTWQLSWSQKYLPSAEPIDARRWPAQPHRIAISDPESSEDGRPCI